MNFYLKDITKIALGHEVEDANCINIGSPLECSTDTVRVQHDRARTWSTLKTTSS